VTVPILEGLDGKIKMGKTTNNYIGVSERPGEMFGKVMSIPDELIVRYFELATDVSSEEIAETEQELKKGKNPRDAKMKLAREIVALYHDQNSAVAAEKEFVSVFSRKELPSDIEQKTIAQEAINIIELLTQTGLTSSKGEARRLIAGGGVRVDGDKIDDVDTILSLKKEKLIQVGKRKYLKVLSPP